MIQVTEEYERLVLELEQRNGAKNEILVAIEEMAECTQQLTKYLRVDTKGDMDNLAEEMADAILGIAKLLVLFENDQAVDRWMKQKIERTKDEVYL